MRRFSPERVWCACEGCGYGIPDGWFFICSSRKENLRSAIWRAANSGRKRVYVSGPRLGAESDGLTYLPVLFFSPRLADESNYLTDSRLIPILLGCLHVIANRHGITLPRRQEQIALQTMLLSVEIEVASMQRIEFFVSSAFDDPSLFDHQDLIGPLPPDDSEPARCWPVEDRASL